MTASSFDQEIGRRLSARRRALKLSLEQLADATGTSFDEARLFERGSRPLKARTLMQICDFLEMSPATLLTGDLAPRQGAFPAPNEAQTINPDLTPEMLEFLENFRDIQSAEIRAHLLALTRSLAAEDKRLRPQHLRVVNSLDEDEQ